MGLSILLNLSRVEGLWTRGEGQQYLLDKRNEGVDFQAVVIFLHLSIPYCTLLHSSISNIPPSLSTHSCKRELDCFSAIKCDGGI